MLLTFLSLLLLVIWPCSAAIDGNPFEGYNVLQNPDFASLATQSGSPCAASKGTFFWVNGYGDTGKIPGLIDRAKQAGPKSILPLVIYGIPARDCSAASSAGGSSDIDTYYGLIDSVQKSLDPSVRTVFVLEPDALGNLITNGNSPGCQAAADTYSKGISYAMQAFDGDNVAIYVDAGNSAWLGDDEKIANLTDVLAGIWKSAKSPKSFRGLATNVSNYRLWQQTVINVSVSRRNNQYSDENSYVTALAQSMQAAGLPAHFITDTSRNGVSVLSDGGFPCNVKGAGLGHSFTTKTNNSAEDAFMWIKPPGQSDGTSDPSASNYDESCSSDTSMPYAPSAGQWFDDYFQMLVKNADPPLNCN